MAPSRKARGSKAGSSCTTCSRPRATAEPGSAMPRQSRAAVCTAAAPAGLRSAPGRRTTLSPSPRPAGGSVRLRSTGRKGERSVPVFWPRTERSRQITKTASARKIRVVASKESCITDPNRDRRTRESGARKAARTGKVRPLIPPAALRKRVSRGSRAEPGRVRETAS
ncbi:protein of unknown function [Methylorubrum extorquens]|uniref:Uncharacterized protein n=1 Tax=Methylorubrum extorquens TaxID=408 RepID=A0A2N9AUP1_METEX|nr:protein of unknown function [Methylorubrum extorquens]